MFSGAGVLIFFKQYLILFREKRENVSIQEPGGRFDEENHEDIEETAKDELFEETCALFNANSLQTKRNYFDISTGSSHLCGSEQTPVRIT